MTSFYMTSLHVNLNEAAKCVDIIPLKPGFHMIVTVGESATRRRDRLGDTSGTVALNGNIF